jgi:hypothetical protein
MTYSAAPGYPRPGLEVKSQGEGEVDVEKGFG